MARNDVQFRLVQLLSTIEQMSNAPIIELSMLERLIDQARWARTYIDLALAFKQHVAVLRDAAWNECRYSTEQDARQLLLGFRDTLQDLSASTANSMELRNLRARVEGVLTVANDWWKAKAAAHSPSAHAQGKS